MVKLTENSVLQFLKSDKLVRIIWIDPDYNYLYFIELNNDTDMPKITEVKTFINLIEASELIIVPDPFIYAIDEDNLPEQYIRKREKSWEIIKFLWVDHKSELLSKTKRIELIKTASNKFGVRDRLIKRILTRFWQRGMVKNALLPDYMNSGGRGKIKKADKKRGRKPKYRMDDVGVNIDESMLNIIRMSIKLFYRKSNRSSIKSAYESMKKKFFSDKTIINGKEKYLVHKKSTYPSYAQFYYWLKKEENIKETFISRHGQKQFELKMREILKNSTMDVFGPGSIYQIDSTIADVYLVSSMDRNNLIGRPVVYSVMDVYSRLIVGIFVGLEGPSWLGAMMALNNVIEDKVAFCKKFGIEINSNEWPNSYLPETIVADRGEFEGYNPENLINNLGVRVDNTPVDRGDLKGIVERYFKTINEHIKHMTPGGIINEYRQRRERDTRYDSILDINDFTKLIILEVIRHNKSVISGYPREYGLISENVKPIPIDIWNWGLKNRACGFKAREKDVIRLNLLYRGEAIIGRKGIRLTGTLGKAYYSCPEALNSQWFLRRVGERVNIVYDPTDMNHIYIPQNKGSGFITCTLLEKCKVYRNLRSEEIVFDYEKEQELIEENYDNQSQVDIDRLALSEEIIKEAKRKTSKSLKENKNSRIKNTRYYREQEKNNIRKSLTFPLQSNDIDNIHSNVNYNVNHNKKSGLKIDLIKRVNELKNG